MLQALTFKDMEKHPVAFKIYQQPNGQLVSVKQGFSWPAFFFTFLWAIYHRLWLAALVLCVGLFLLNRIADWSQHLVNSSALESYVSYAIALFGVIGNKLIERKLIAKGSVLRGTSRLASGKDALEEFGRLEAESVKS